MKTLGANVARTHLQFARLMQDAATLNDLAFTLSEDERALGRTRF